MRLLFTGLLLGCALLGGPTNLSLAAQEPAAAKQIQTIYRRFDQAYKKKNSKAIQALMRQYMTPDFTRQTGGTAPVPRAVLIRRAGTDLDRIASVLEAATRIRALKVNGGTATALVDSTFVGTMNDAHQITLKLSNRSTSRSWFVKTGSGWKVKKMVELSHQFRVNDRLIRSHPPAKPKP